MERTISITQADAQRRADEAERQRKAQAAAEEAERARRQQAEQRRAEEAERARQAQQVAAAQQAEAEARKASDQWSQRAAKEWQLHHDYIMSLKANVVTAVAENEAWRKQCYQAKRQITAKVGQVTNGARQIRQVVSGVLPIKAIGKVQSRPQIEGLDTVLRSLQPIGDTPYLWGLNHLAKALIKQAETEIAAKPTAAFPLGRIVIALLFEVTPNSVRC